MEHEFVVYHCIKCNMIKGYNYKGNITPEECQNSVKSDSD